MVDDDLGSGTRVMGCRLTQHTSDHNVADDDDRGTRQPNLTNSTNEGSQCGE